MTTLLVTLDLTPERSEDVLVRLRGEAAPWLRRLPGFATSRWLLTGARDRCYVVVEVEDAHADDASHALHDAMAPGAHDTARSWWCERIEDVVDLGLAARPPVTP